MICQHDWECSKYKWKLARQLQQVKARSRAPIDNWPFIWISTLCWWPFIEPVWTCIKLLKSLIMWTLKSDSSTRRPKMQAKGNNWCVKFGRTGSRMEIRLDIPVVHEPCPSGWVKTNTHSKVAHSCLGIRTVHNISKDPCSAPSL